MPRFTIIIFSFLLAFTFANCHVKPQDTKKLALQILSGAKKDFDGQIYDKLHIFYQAYRDCTVASPELFKELAKFYNVIDECVWYVDEAYKRYVQFRKDPANRKAPDLMKREDVEDPLAGLSHYVEKIGKVVGNNTFSIIMDTLSMNKDPKTNCTSKQSTEVLIAKLYEVLMLTEVESLVVQLYSLELLRKKNEISLENIKNKALENFNNRMAPISYNALRYIDQASRENAKCNFESKTQ